MGPGPVRQSGCRALVAAKAFKGSDYVAMVQEVRGDAPALEHAIFFDDPSWEQLLAGARTSTTPRCASAPPRSTPAIRSTSSTRRARPVRRRGQRSPTTTSSTASGACVVLPSEAFDPLAVLEAVQGERCTVLYGVPTMFIAQLVHPEFGRFDLTSLRSGIMAGSPCPVETMRQVIDRMHMHEVTIAYGMTETSPISTQTGADDDVEHRTATVGRVHPHVEIRVADPHTGRTLSRGEPGEFQTRGYSVMLGYWEDPDRTAEAIDGARWMHTGDLAVMDEDGYVRIVGRIKDMIIRGGENVYPREIEEFLHGHDDIVDVQVVGVPDARFGGEICAWVQFRDGATAGEDELREYCKGRIAHLKVPRYIRRIDEFPMTVTGKVRKVELRERAIVELDLQEAAAITAA